MVSVNPESFNKPLQVEMNDPGTSIQIKVLSLLLSLLLLLLSLLLLLLLLSLLLLLLLLLLYLHHAFPYLLVACNIDIARSSIT